MSLDSEILRTKLLDLGWGAIKMSLVGALKMLGKINA